jgi:hypothetical protein
MEYRPAAANRVSGINCESVAESIEPAVPHTNNSPSANLMLPFIAAPYEFEYLIRPATHSVIATMLMISCGRLRTRMVHTK